MLAWREPQFKGGSVTAFYAQLADDSSCPNWAVEGLFMMGTNAYGFNFILVRNEEQPEALPAISLKP